MTTNQEYIDTFSAHGWNALDDNGVIKGHPDNNPSGIQVEASISVDHRTLIVTTQDDENRFIDTSFDARFLSMTAVVGVNTGDPRNLDQALDAINKELARR